MLRWSKHLFFSLYGGNRSFDKLRMAGSKGTFCFKVVLVLCSAAIGGVITANLLAWGKLLAG
jgi:hypothetical protein